MRLVACSKAAVQQQCPALYPGFPGETFAHRKPINSAGRRTAFHRSSVPLMNCTTATLCPQPSARMMTPKAELDFPLPLPVNQHKSPISLLFAKRFLAERRLAFASSLYVRR